MRHFFFFMTENEETNQDVMFAEEYCTITYAKKKFTGHSSKSEGVTAQIWRIKPSVFRL